MRRSADFSPLQCAYYLTIRCLSEIELKRNKFRTPAVHRASCGNTFLLRFAFLCLFCAPCLAHAADTNALLSGWLDSQKTIRTWSADFVQTRRLKSFTEPLTATGQVWFAAPNQFRWELGNPPQTIALRQPDQMLVIYPRLKRVEKYPLTGAAAGQWKDTMALLEAGFPRDRAELESRFKVSAMSVSNAVCEITLVPTSSQARKMIPQMKIAFGTNDFSLLGTELEFADGSTMRNDFQNPKINEPSGDDRFQPKLDPGFKLVEPMKGK